LKGQVAQLVEQRTENPCVDGSIPPLAINRINHLQQVARPAFLLLGHIWDKSILPSLPVSPPPDEPPVLLRGHNTDGGFDRFTRPERLREGLTQRRQFTIDRRFAALSSAFAEVFAPN
jgi:hypothetical protein